jgi:DNA polymerase-1
MVDACVRSGTFERAVPQALSTVYSMKRLLVIDGSNICHRSYHALSGTGLRDGDDRPVWALHGMLTLMGKLIDDTGATHVVVCRDLPGGCPSRKERVPAYKAHRSAPDADLRVQLNRYPELLDELGCANIAAEGWEADDLIASCAKHGRENGYEVIVITSDRDAYQVIQDGVRVVRPEGVIVTDAVVRKKYGIDIVMYRRLAALVGEPGDGIDGIPRVGVKTAAKMLEYWGEKLDEVIDDVEMMKLAGLGQKLAETVVEHAGVYRRNLEVAVLKDDLDVRAAIEASSLDSWDADHIQRVSREWGLPRAGASLWAGVGETAPF